MATTKCNISFKLDFTSTSPLTGAAYSYKLKNTSDIPTSVNIIPLPANGDIINIPTDSLAIGDYDLTLALTSTGVSASQTASFKIGNCNPSSCETPVINSVNVLSDGQIVMDYTVVNIGSWSPEYQIATDIGFTNIVYSRVGFAYTQIENVNMNTGKIPNNTTLYIRAKKYCAPAGTVSNWSNVVQFTSRNWVVQQAPYSINPACCVPAKYTNPTDINQLGSTICVTGNQWTKSVHLDTPSPQIGSKIYLNDGITPAIPGNLSSFDNVGVLGFDASGIRWVRFSNINGNLIYEVKPTTGEIIGISSFNC